MFDVNSFCEIANYQIKLQDKIYREFKSEKITIIKVNKNQINFLETIHNKKL